MSLFLLLFSLQGGIVPRDGAYVYAPYFDNMEYTFNFTDQRYFMTFEAELDFLKIFYIGGKVKTIMSWRNNTISFDPTFLDFTFSAGFKIGNNIEIGFNHFCTHPMFTYLVSYDKRFKERKLEGSYEELYIKVKGEMEF